jgi:hypothetical protein
MARAKSGEFTSFGLWEYSAFLLLVSLCVTFSKVIINVVQYSEIELGGVGILTKHMESCLYSLGNLSVLL